VVLATYAVMNLAYSVWLKHFVLLDVFMIALGFLFRVTAGAFAIEVDISFWLLICTFFISLFLAFCKRRHELESLGDDAIVPPRQPGALLPAVHRQDGRGAGLDDGDELRALHHRPA
jgi:hypothetical protein